MVRALKKVNDTSCHRCFRRRLIAMLIALPLAACQPVSGSPEPSAGPSVEPSVEPSAATSSAEPYAGAEALVSVAAGPRGVAEYAGSIWVACTRGGLIQRVDPRTNAITAEIRAGERPVTLVTAGGALWASVLNGEPSSDDTVVRLDAETNAVDLKVAVPVFHNIAAGAGAVWVVDSLGVLRRVDAATGQLTEAVAAGADTVGLAADDNAVWGIRGNGVVWRYPTSAGELVEADLGVTVPGRSRAAIGPEGLVVAVPGTVLVLDPDRLVRLTELALPGMTLVNDLFETDTDVWLSANLKDLALELDGGAVLRLDPVTLEIRDVYHLGPESSGVVVAGGYVWAVDQQDDRLARFSLD